MTQEQLRVKLATDPDFIFSYIYGNNPDAVIANLRGLGFLVNNTDDVFTAINELHESNRDDLIEQAFGVAILTDGLDPRELAVIQDVLTAQAQAVQGGPQRKINISSEAWVGIAGAAVALIGAFAGKGGVKPTDTTAVAQTPPKKDNTLTYVLIGVGCLVLFIGAVIVLKKK